MAFFSKTKVIDLYEVEATVPNPKSLYDNV